MNESSYWERFKIFLKNIPKTVKETFIWFLFSYMIPLFNIGIIWAIQGQKFSLTLNIYSIIIITNACFFTSLYHLAFDYNKDEQSLLYKRSDGKFIKTINIVTYIITVVLFTTSIIETEKKIEIFSLSIYKMGAIISFIIALLLGLISKYDEVEALSIVRATQGKSTKETSIGNKKIKLQ